jgi:DNA repair exonuclease SbcCD nuclease subunit
MNFVHIGDVHFDVAFSTISSRANFGEERRLEQRKGFKQVIDFVKEHNVEYLFISGDLYEADNIRKSTIDYINNLFKEIPNTKIYIAPGNHDPRTKNSYYEIYNWSANVTIFDSTVLKIEEKDVDIYGFGFDNFEMRDFQLNDIFVSNKSKNNILVTHGDLYTNTNYNPISTDVIKAKGFDYAAIGHIHKRDDYYPGSLVSLGFDEPGEHGFIYGELNNKELKKEFIKVEQKEFVTENVDVSEMKSNEELIETLNNINTNNNFYEIYLVGNRHFEINVNLKLVQNNIIKVKDKTKIEVVFEENDNTIRGIFIKLLNEKLQSGEINEEKYQRIMELGLNSLEK